MKKTIAFLVLITITLRMAVLAGANEKAEGWLRNLAADGKLAATSIQLELGINSAHDGEDEIPSSADAVKTETPSASTAPVPSPTTASTQDTSESKKSTETSEPVQIVPTTISGGLVINNDTSFEPDISTLLSEPMPLKLPAEGPQILIIHTHGSEAYTPDAVNPYTPTDTSRTEDKNYNIIRVGDALTEALETKGLRVLHDREIYDYPSYTGSYNRSQAAIEAYLQQYPDIAIVLDIHRDALGSGDVVYKTVADVSGEPSSQLMLLVATGETGLYHPNWQENLKLALHLQSEVNNHYPTLARPIALKPERYNQHLTTGSLILEVGSSGNTLQEAINAVTLFASAIGDYLLSLT